MGLADFLAEAGGNAPVGNIARAAGGKTIAQRDLDSYINNDLPALAQEIQANTDRTKIPALQMKFIQTSLKAGLPMPAVEKLSDMLIGPHLQGIKEDELNKFREDLQGLPASPRPQTGNELVKGPDVPAVPPRPLDQEMAVRFGDVIGAKPELMAHLLGTPAEIAAKQASTAKTQGEIDREARAARQREGLSNVPTAPGQPSPQDIGILNPPGLQQFLPQRDKPEDPLLEERRALITAQTGAANSLASLRDLGGSGRGAGGQGTTTESPRLVTPAIQADAAKQIAKAANDRGMTTPAQIQQIADEFGYTLEGSPVLDEGWFTPSIKGNFRLTPKDVTKTVTKGAPQPSGQGRYSQGVPTGSAPVPAQGQPGGQARKPTPEEVKAAKKRLGIP